MGEAWGHILKKNEYNFYSAGTKKHGLNPHAIKVMAEKGYDLKTHTSKTTNELPDDIHFDYVITVCGDAHETCPIYHGSTIVHQPFDDPPRLTQEMTEETEILAVYRRVRDEIEAYIRDFPN